MSVIVMICLHLPFYKYGLFVWVFILLLFIEAIFLLCSSYYFVIMDAQCHLLRNVTADSDGWKVKVRVVRLWKQHVYMNPSEINSLEMVLMDAEGSKISASIKKFLISKFEGLLVEGRVYFLSNFGVADNNLRVKMSMHAFRINFLNRTKVNELKSGFPLTRSVFSFVDFQSIIDSDIGEGQAIDVIGVLSGYTDPLVTTSDGRTTKRVCFELQNEMRHRLRCTLWSEFANEFTRMVLSFDGNGPPVVVIQLGRLRPWLGKPAVSNCYFGTKVLFTPDEPTVLALRERVLANPRIPVSPVKYADLSQLNIAHTLSEFAPGCERVFINDVGDIREIRKFIVFGKVLCVQKEQLWYYVACSKCHKSVPDDTLDKYSVEDCKGWKCAKCEQEGSGFEYRYKLQIRVKDKTGSASLCLFDPDASRIIGVSAYDLFKTLPADMEVDFFPDELNAMVGHIYVFMVGTAKYNLEANYRVFTVGSVSNEPDLLANFESEIVLLQKGVLGGSGGNASGTVEVSCALPNENSIVVVNSSSAATSPTGKRCKDNDVADDKQQAFGSGGNFSGTVEVSSPLPNENSTVVVNSSSAARSPTGKRRKDNDVADDKQQTSGVKKKLVFAKKEVN